MFLNTEGTQKDRSCEGTFPDSNSSVYLVRCEGFKFSFFFLSFQSKSRHFVEPSLDEPVNVTLVP